MNFKKFSIKIHIRGKIVLVYILTFIPILFIIVTLIINLSNNYSMNVSVRNNQLILNNTVQQVDDAIKDMERITLLTISDDNLQNILINYKNDYSYHYLVNQESMSKFFLNLISIRQSVISIRIIKDNRIIYGYNENDDNFNKSTDYNNENWIKKLNQDQDGRKTLILGTHLVDDIEYSSNCQVADKYAISVARRINKTFTNQLLGYIKIDTSYNTIQKIINQYKNKDSEIIISDQDNNIIYYKDFKMINKKLDKILKLNGTAAAGSVCYQKEMGGKNYLVTSLTSDYTGWTTYCLTPESVVNGDLQEIKKFDYLIILIGIAIAVSLSILFSKAITKNIIKLNNSMKQVEKGNFNIMLTPESKDEIGELTVTFNNMVKRINKLIQQEYIALIKNQKLEINQKQTELQVLLSQVNPHFLYNTLDVIRINAALNSDKSTESMLFCLSKFYRMNQSNCTVKGTLEQELNIVSAYIQICKYRFKHLEFFINNSVEKPSDYLVPRFILQPIIENAINHGMETEDKSCIVSLQTYIQHDSLEIYISDNGKGLESARIEQLNSEFRIHADNSNEGNGSGIGLKNVNKRIYLIYGTGYGITLKPNAGHGITVVIKLPIDLKM